MKSTQNTFDNKILSYIASKSILKTKRDRSMVDPLKCGGYIFKGELKIEMEDNLGVHTTSYMNVQAGELVRASNSNWISNGETIFLEFTTPLENDNTAYNDRPSFMGGSAYGNRMSVQRMSVSENIGVMINDSVQTNNEFKT